MAYAVPTLRRAPVPGPVIIGGGPAGAAAATLLARAGHAVTLIERGAAAVHKVCGDFLSGEAIEAIAALGVDLSPLASAPVTTLRLVHGHHVATTRLPFPAAGLTRRALDEALLRHAAKNGATVLRGHAVRGISQVGTRWVDGGAIGTFRPKTVFLATGKHDLRGMPRPSPPTPRRAEDVLRPIVGARRCGVIELVLFAGSYAGLQLLDRRAVSSAVRQIAGRARLLGDVARLVDRRVSTSGKSAARCATHAERPLAIAGLPYGFRHAPTAHERGPVPPGRSGNRHRLAYRRRRRTRPHQRRTGDTNLDAGRQPSRTLPSHAGTSLGTTDARGLTAARLREHEFGAALAAARLPCLAGCYAPCRLLDPRAKDVANRAIRLTHGGYAA